MDMDMDMYMDMDMDIYVYVYVLRNEWWFPFTSNSTQLNSKIQGSTILKILIETNCVAYG